MRVLTVLPSFDVGGLERIAVDLGNAMVARGHEVTFAADEGPLAAGLDPRVRRFGLGAAARNRGALDAARTAVGIARAVRAARPDVVHAHNVRITGLAAVGRLLAGSRAPLVGTFHGVDPGEDRAARLVLRAASEVVCVSEGLAARLGSGVVIPNAVAPVAPAAVAPRDRLVVAFVGRLMPVKAPGRFVEMARSVEGATFVVVGDGPLRPALELAAAGLDVRFLGWRTDARELIAQADLLVVSSDSEGLSVAALEALSAGVPVVSTPVTGMAELLGAGGGVVVPRFDASDLAAAVRALLADPAARARHGAAGRELIARRYGLDAMVDAYEALFARL